MPVGETTEEHKKWQEEEASLVEKDRSNNGPSGGLFRGCFRMWTRRTAPIIRDVEDGVDRCPRCTWELEDGLCGSCGYPSGEDSTAMSDSESQAYWDDIDGMDMHAMDGDMMEALEEEARIHGYEPFFDGLDEEEDGSEHGYSSEEAMFRVHPRPTRGRDASPARLNHSARAVNRPNTRGHSNTEPPYDSFLDESDLDSEDEDEVGSLDGFVVNDAEDRPPSTVGSSRSIHWASDEEAEEMQIRASDEDPNAHSDNSSHRNEGSVPTTPYNVEEDSDEDPILPSRRQVSRQSVTSNESSSGEALQALAAIHDSRGHRDRLESMDGAPQPQRNIPHHSRGTNRRGGRSRRVPTEVASDSDSPVPLQRPRRRPPVRNNVDSNDSSAVEASSATATVGRRSPRQIPQRSSNPRRAAQARNVASPIVIESSPVRPTNAEDQRLAVPGAFPPSSERSLSSFAIPMHRPNLFAPGLAPPANFEADNSPRSSNTLRSPTRSPQPNRRQQRPNERLRSPRPGLQSLGLRRPRQSPSSADAPRSGAEGRFEQGVREREHAKAERKAERRRRKHEREQRRREQVEPSVSPGRPQ